MSDPTFPATTDPDRSPVEPDASGSTSQAAKAGAADVKDSAADAARDVTGTAKEQARQVAGEVGERSRDLLSRTTSELSDQAGRQQRRLADSVTGYAGELRDLASKTDHPGLVSDLANQAADRGERAGEWLSRREPGDLLDEVRGFARRRPGAFLVAAAVSGLVVGRLSRGLFADAKGGDPALRSGQEDPGPARGSQPGARPAATLQEIPTSGSGAGPTYDDPINDPINDPSDGRLDGPFDGPVSPGPTGQPVGGSPGGLTR